MEWDARSDADNRTPSVIANQLLQKMSTKFPGCFDLSHYVKYPTQVLQLRLDTDAQDRIAGRVEQTQWHWTDTKGGLEPGRIYVLHTELLPDPPSNGSFLPGSTPPDLRQAFLGFVVQLNEAHEGWRQDLEEVN